MFGLKTRTLVIGGVLAAVIGTGAVASRYNNPSIEDRANFATYMITKKLELNDAQEAKLDALAKVWIGNASTRKPFRQAMLDEVKSLASGDNLSVEQVDAFRAKIKAEFDRRADQLVPQFVSFYNDLNADQKAKVVARLDKVSERMKKGGFRRGFHRFGPRHWKDAE